jgi:phenylacetate-CoA ligase
MSAILQRVKRPFALAKNYLDTRVLPALETSQSWSPREQDDFQSSRLVGIYRHHFANTPEYRELCVEHGLDRLSVRGLEDIERLPIIERSWLRERSGVRNRQFEAGAVMHTGGSTGELLEYAGCRRYHTLRQRAHLRGWGYFGLHDSEEFTVIASAQASLTSARNLSGELSLENIKRIVASLENPGSEFVRGYASSCFIVSAYMLQQGIENRVVRFFNLVSENVYDWQREAISSAFPESEIYEEYVCNDGGASAWECPAHNGLHEAIERAIIEPGESGEIIATDLWNRAMPFIRYRNGDRLVERVKDPCICGRSLPRIRVRGRTNDVLVTPFGPVSPTYLMMWGAGYEYTGATHNRGIAQLQYIQTPGYQLTVNVVRSELYTPDDLCRLQEQVGRICRGMTVDYRLVSQIDTTASGKRRFIVNEDRELLAKWVTHTLD